jgi:ion channel-forming bestrophin family protein
MHLGKKYSFRQFLGWTGWEALCLTLWALIVTAVLHLTQWDFLTMPAPVLTIVGSALAIILAFKNSQCYARFNEALVLSGQLSTNSLILANRLTSTIGALDDMRSGGLKDMFYRHFAWLTALRFFLREKKAWENTAALGNKRFLKKFPTPESTSSLKDELKTYLPASDVERVLSHPGDKEALLLRWQYDALSALYNKQLFSEYMLMVLTGALDDLARVQGALKRTKNYPYARNFYSIAVFLVWIFVTIVPFSLYPYARELGEEGGISWWTGWLNVPFSAVIGWIFVSLEKVGENSSNPFEGGSNDVPISAITRRIEIEMRSILGEEPGLKPIEAKGNILL